MRTEYSGGVGFTTCEEASDLSEFEFQTGDEFVRWTPWGDEPESDEVWAVISVSFKYTVSWVRDRDNVPTVENHRRYTLMSRDTLEEHETHEANLKRGEWKKVGEGE